MRTDLWNHTVRDMYKSGALKQPSVLVGGTVVASNVRDANLNAVATHNTGGEGGTMQAIEIMSAQALQRAYLGTQILNNQAHYGKLGGVTNVAMGILATRSWREGGKEEWCDLVTRRQKKYQACADGQWLMRTWSDLKSWKR